MNEQDQEFLNELGRHIKFHVNNTNDPYNISIPVSVALMAVKEAFEISRENSAIRAELNAAAKEFMEGMASNE